MKRATMMRMGAGCLATAILFGCATVPSSDGDPNDPNRKKGGVSFMQALSTGLAVASAANSLSSGNFDASTIQKTAAATRQVAALVPPEHQSKELRAVADAANLAGAVAGAANSDLSTQARLAAATSALEQAQSQLQAAQNRQSGTNMIVVDRNQPAITPYEPIPPPVAPPPAVLPPTPIPQPTFTPIPTPTFQPPATPTPVPPPVPIPVPAPTPEPAQPPTWAEPYAPLVEPAPGTPSRSTDRWANTPLDIAGTWTTLWNAEHRVDTQISQKAQGGLELAFYRQDPFDLGPGSGLLEFTTTDDQPLMQRGAYRVEAKLSYAHRRNKRLFVNDTLEGDLHVRREPHGGITLRFVPDQEFGTRGPIILTISLIQRR